MNGALHPDLAEALRRGEAFSAAVCNGGMPIGRGCGTGSVPLSGCSGACAPPTHPLCTHSAPDLVGIPWMGTGLPPGAGVKGQVGPHGMHACPLSLHAPNSLALPFLPPPRPSPSAAPHRHARLWAPWRFRRRARWVVQSPPPPSQCIGPTRLLPCTRCRAVPVFIQQNVPPIPLPHQPPQHQQRMVSKRPWQPQGTQAPPRRNVRPHLSTSFPAAASRPPTATAATPVGVLGGPPSEPPPCPLRPSTSSRPHPLPAGAPLRMRPPPPPPPAAAAPHPATGTPPATVGAAGTMCSLASVVRLRACMRVCM